MHRPSVRPPNCPAAPVRLSPPNGQVGPVACNGQGRASGNAQRSGCQTSFLCSCERERERGESERGERAVTGPSLSHYHNMLPFFLFFSLPSKVLSERLVDSKQGPTNAFIPRSIRPYPHSLPSVTLPPLQEHIHLIQDPTASQHSLTTTMSNAQVLSSGAEVYAKKRKAKQEQLAELTFDPDARK